MKIETHNLYSALLIILSVIACSDIKRSDELPPLRISSPNGENCIEFTLLKDGQPAYLVTKGDELIIDTSSIGLEFKDQAPLNKGFNLEVVNISKFDSIWEMPWGEQSSVRDNGSEMIIELKEKELPNRQFNLFFRAYDDGVAFRYEIGKMEGVDSVIVIDEHSEFELSADHTCWWIPGDWDIYEHLYHTTKFSEIDALVDRDHPNLAQTYIPFNAVNTPVTMKTESGTHLSFHEAALTNYPGMTLLIDNDNLKMTSGLVGSDRLGYKAKIKLPFKSPWRTIQISENAAGLIDSRMILNLNEPNRLGDVSYFEPKKYMGIWWEMHLGRSSWDYDGTQDMDSQHGGVASAVHGANTAHAKEIIDFASERGITGLLVEGWNTGWEYWIGFDDREGVFDFITPYPDYDLEEVCRYGREKGVEIIMHHETSSAPRTYEQQMDTAFALMQSLGMHSVKTGYVGPIIPKGEYHHGQWMVQHYRRVLETAAKYEVAINAHEPIKATGIRRTLPNAIAREGLRGQEFNAWSAEGGNPPEHLPIVAFTRMLGGPIDYTPGAFEFQNKRDDGNTVYVKSTLANQLALYVVIYSPVQMACDILEHYEDQPAFQFITDAGVDWEQSMVLNGEVGDFVTIAREEKETGNWFVGGITDEEERTLEIDFQFLDEGKKYKTTIYRDGDNAHWKDNPKDIIIEEIEINNQSELQIKLAPGGGFAISLLAE